MDVNMNLHAIYPSPFGCLCSITALRGHGRVFDLSRVAFPVPSPVVPCDSCVRLTKRRWDQEILQSDVWTLTIRLFVNAQQKLEYNCGLHPGSISFMQEDKGISTLCELVSYTTLRCGLLPSHCGLLIIAGWNSVWLNKTAAPLQRMMDMFLIRFSTHFSESPDGHRRKTKQMRLSFQKIGPETISLSSCITLVFYCNLPQSAEIQLNSFLFSPRTGI